MLTRTTNQTEIDTSIYWMYVDAAVKGSKDLQCIVTLKVHLMLEHVEWQMTIIEGGLGIKMEDWVEHLHQTGKQPVPALLHSAEPSSLLTCQGESKLAQHASICDCSNRQNKHGEQAQSGRVKG